MIWISKHYVWLAEMKILRTIVVIVVECALIVSISSTARCVFPAALSFSSQSRGNLVEQRIQKIQSDFAAVDGIQMHLASGSVDGEITTQLLTRAWLSLRDAQGALRALEYTRADQRLDSAALDVENANRITAEDANIPEKTLLNESKEDKYLDSVEQTIPVTLSNRKRRALIWSEQSLVNKMFQKATTHHCPLNVIPADPTERQMWEFGGRYTVENTQWSAYLVAASDKLDALQYDESHRMMYEAYREAQKILARCAVQP